MSPVVRAHEPVDVQGLPAGLVSRGVAAVVDGLVLLGAVVVVELAFASVRYLLLGPPFSMPHPGPWITLGAGCAAAVAYLAGSWVTAGRTAGDQVMGLRVTNRSGARLSPGAAVARAVLWLVIPWGVLWIPASRRGASVQDLLVGSAVVHDWYGHSRTSAHGRHE
ncbi:RDD family protein [Streptomyces sp. NPDC086766]|uniref:RDD family protein n=1 Tax=Streptomyces sp. NPDC086766 TaxID=3365754 RepID=UPI0038096A0D